MKIHIPDPSDKAKCEAAVDQVAEAVAGLIVDPSQRALTVTVGSDTLNQGLVLEVIPHVVHTQVQHPDRRIARL